MQEDETDEEERSMRRTSRTRRMRMTAALTTTTAMNDEKELSAPTFRSTKDLDTPSWTYLCFVNIRGNNWFLRKFGGASIMRRGRGGSLGVSIPTGPAS